MKFKCPECRKDDPSNDSDYSSNPEDFVEEREELLRKLDKLNILVDQERREVENLKEKEKEHIRKSQEEKVRKEDQIKTMKQQVADLKKEKNRWKQSRSSSSAENTKLRSEVKDLKQDKSLEVQRAQVLKRTNEKQAETINLKDKKIAELEKIIQDNKSSGVSKERLLELETSLEKQRDVV